jgi:integrase
VGRLPRPVVRPPGRDPHHPRPPVLAWLLRAHIKRSGTDPDGPVFQTARGGILQDSGYNEVWDQARKMTPTPARYRSPLGRRPYDLRHAAGCRGPSPVRAGGSPGQCAAVQGSGADMSSAALLARRASAAACAG